MTTNQDPKYEAERDEAGKQYFEDTSTGFVHYEPSFMAGADWATSYWSKRMVPLDVVEKLVEALKYYADERENERKINVCEFNVNLNRMYVCGDGSRAREALAEYEKATGGE